MSAKRFPVLFTGANRAMKLLGITPKNSFLDLTEDAVSVQMGWAFRATIPRGSVRNAGHDNRRVLGWGVHGWRGRWLVNGSSRDIVALDIEPAGRARLMSVIPIALRELRISVEAPDELINAFRS